MDANELREAIIRLRAEDDETVPAPNAEPGGSVDQTIEEVRPWLWALKKAWSNLMSRKERPQMHQI